MKTCPVCALDLEDSYLFCPDDGSNLNSLPGRSSKPVSASAPATEGEKTRGVVLYCPACAAEYPLTFSSCPVHGLQLTKHSIPRPDNGPSLREPETGAQADVQVLNLRRDHSRHTNQLTTINLRRPQIEGPNFTRVEPLPAKRVEPAGPVTDVPEDVPVDSFYPLPGSEVVGDINAFDHQESTVDAHERRMERPGFRVAAIATVIALALFGLLAVLTLVSNFSRRSNSPTSKTASTAQSTPQPLPFVATPQEAQDYKEEAQVPSPSAEQPSEPPVERVRRGEASSSTELAGRKNPGVQPVPKSPVAAPSPPPVTTARVSNPPMPALPRGNSGGFDARLIRVRSRKTPAGFRYDLTFNMQEQAGRAAHWQRVLISTRSASGASRSEAIPFSHRLGAAGALTFTISVELTGRSEADWQGRVVCTTLGWDNKGAPLQASFGANVNP